MEILSKEEGKEQFTLPHLKYERDRLSREMLKNVPCLYILSHETSFRLRRLHS